MATHSSVLAWIIPGTEEPGSCRLWGHTEVDTTEMIQQQSIKHGLKVTRNVKVTWNVRVHSRSTNQ